MLCRAPFFKDGKSFGCGQCIYCRINSVRVWTHRLMLELKGHERACFVTLTYSDEFLPDGGNLQPRDLQLFLKRLRRRLAPVTIRFFACGEYGEQTLRPHYHVLLYGIDGFAGKEINECWGLGMVHIGLVTWESCQYVCGYMKKGMTKELDPRLQGKCPEFSRMSRNPGIGAYACDVIAETLTTANGAKVIAAAGDVPRDLRHGGKLWPLGRYMERKLRDALGFEDLARQENEAVQRVRAARERPSDWVAGSTAQRRRNVDARLRIFGQKKGRI